MLMCQVFVAIACVFKIAVSGYNLCPKEFRDYINANQNLWIARRTFHKDLPLSYFRRLAGSLHEGLQHIPQKQYKEGSYILPKNFDARRKWPYCASLKEIKDQGSCGSCWAVSAVSAMSNRLCIKTRGHKHFMFSEQDILTCCNNCGHRCKGGYLSKAWEFAHRKGVVSGGNYNSSKGCKPYSIAPCEHNINGPRPQCDLVEAPKCKMNCQAGYRKKYARDKTRIGNVYRLNTTYDMQRDIIEHGPITATLDVYTDLYCYRSGIYKQISKEYIGKHSVKLIGWGESHGVGYWLVANSWNTDWGERGFFKILRNKNHCGIESYALAGYVHK